MRLTRHTLRTIMFEPGSPDDQFCKAADVEALERRLEWFEEGLKLVREHINQTEKPHLKCKYCKWWLAAEPEQGVMRW